jgi:hypothetical protein
LAETLLELFDEYAVRYARGEQPDPVPYLQRAGDAADELSNMLDVFLQWAPSPAPDEVTVALMEAWLAGEPPLRELRIKRGLRVEEVTRHLLEAFHFDIAHRPKLQRYFQRLERGSLDQERLDRRIFDALAQLFDTPASNLFMWASAPRGAGPADAPAFRSDHDTTTAAAPAARDEGWDEVDELFLGHKPDA